MSRALELAEIGKGKVTPNPMVGCVIVHEDKIIGEGYHQAYGGPHAEVNAIAEVKNKSLLSESTLFVTLEPCSHWGITPPCADLIIQYKIRKVIVCNLDSNPLVSGNGIVKLQDAGIEVGVGILDEDGRWLNKRFFTFMEKKRPYIILKWAETADGFIARENYNSKWISNDLSRKMVHKWRSEEAAIMVGTNTALHDNPKLNLRDWSGRNPIRIVIDRDLKLPNTFHLFDNQQSTLCFNANLDQPQEALQYIKIDFDQEIIPQILQALYKRKIDSVIVEGGAVLLENFIQLNIWDEIRCFQSRKLFQRGIKAPHFEGIVQKEYDILDDRLKIFHPLPEKDVV